MPVTVVVEDGSGVVNANAYLSVAAWKAYADQLGWDYSAFTNDQIGSAIIRGRRANDAYFRSRWPGEAVTDLAWPRSGVVTDAGDDFPEVEIPQGVIDANAESAWVELREPGTLTQPIERRIKSVSAGSVSVVFADYAPFDTSYPDIENALAFWLTPLDASATIVSWPARA